MSVNELLPETVPSSVDRDTQTVELVEDSIVFEILATDTARRVMLTLNDAPYTASEIAADLDMSVQNVCYHLERLQKAGLIEAVGTQYSSKGKEMTVYALVTESIVLQFEDDKEYQTVDQSERDDAVVADD